MSQPIVDEARQRRRHILTVVLEDYCHVAPVSGVIPTDYWHRFESRVQRNTDLALDLLDEVGAKATFFVLGWIGEHQPQVVAEVVRRGHEVASKGYFHRSIRQMTPDQFREDVRRSRDALQDATGQAVRGYRVPRGGFGDGDEWALDVLIEEGFLFDSSSRPLGLAFSGEPHRRFIHSHRTATGSIWEVPLSTWKLGPLYLPISGGNFVRQLPEHFIRHAVAAWENEVGDPLVFYFHVWELDPDQPRIKAVSKLNRVRQYRNLGQMPDRIRYYLEEYSFGGIAEHLQLPAPAAAPVRTAPPVAAPIIATGGEHVVRLPISVIVPCYNEEATLGYTANTLRAFAEEVREQFEVSYVFVDDGSQDGTWKRLNELFGSRQDCVLVRHAHNRGVAAATLTGIANSRCEVVCAIDCDGTYDPLQLRKMVPMLTPDVDMVTASPYHPEGRVLNLSAWRLLLSKGLSMVYWLFHHHKLYTYTSCFRVYRRSSMKDIFVRNERFVGIMEILSRVDAQGGRIVECPAVMEVRLLGSSKMKILKTIWGHLLWMGRMIFRHTDLVPPKLRVTEEKLSDTAGHA
jgi:polysaccharide deacetylase family protein (PEP-CTERM system associated)